MPGTAIALVLMAVMALLLGSGGSWIFAPAAPRDEGLTGVVVTPHGAPIAGATARSGELTAVTDAEGRFALAGTAGWVSVSADGWLPRSRVAVPGRDVVVRLAPRRPGTVTITFAGDVMFGRRLYDPDEDGVVDGLLRGDSGVREHQDLLSRVSPLLEGSDLTAVNLESPLVEDPWFDPLGERPTTFHPTKEYVFGAARASAEALVRAGVDVVDLGNNHMYDRLDEGVATTTAALRSAGLRRGQGYFGAGHDREAAWGPAYRTVRGQRIAFTGCTSIQGELETPVYVAGPTKGGPAGCEPRRLRRAVQAAHSRADVVVAMVHGGFEYDRDPSARVQQLSDVAVAAGADLVIDHHPHVLGGMRFSGGRLTAWTLGNLLFDQTLWPTFDTSVLQVAVRDGRVVNAWAEPLRAEGFLPTPVVGRAATWVTQGILARSEGPWLADDGSLWLDTAGAALSGHVPTDRDTLVRIRRGCAPGAARELLWTGDFEPREVGARVTGSLWNVVPGDPYRRVLGDAAHRGRAGVLLHRASSQAADVLLNPLHRVLVTSGDRLTILVDHQAVHGSPVARLQLSWYNDTRGASQDQTVVELPATGEWRTTRIDAVVPRNAVAVLPMIRLAPPEHGVAQLAVDDVRLLNWGEVGCDYVESGQTVSLVALPPLSRKPAVSPVEAGWIEARTPRRLPPGPAELVPSVTFQRTGSD